MELKIKKCVEVEETINVEFPLYNAFKVELLDSEMSTYAKITETETVEIIHSINKNTGEESYYIKREPTNLTEIHGSSFSSKNIIYGDDFDTAYLRAVDFTNQILR